MSNLSSATVTVSYLEFEEIVAERNRYRDEIKTADASLVEGFDVIEQLCKSMHPHPKEHPAMFAAKERGAKYMGMDSGEAFHAAVNEGGAS